MTAARNVRHVRFSSVCTQRANETEPQIEWNAAKANEIIRVCIASKSSRLPRTAAAIDWSATKTGASTDCVSRAVCFQCVIVWVPCIFHSLCGITAAAFAITVAASRCRCRQCCCYCLIDNFPFFLNKCDLSEVRCRCYLHHTYAHGHKQTPYMLYDSQNTWNFLPTAALTHAYIQTHTLGKIIACIWYCR